MSDDTIVPDNVRVVGAVHFSAMLDAMRAFDVVDRLVELATLGRLPLHRQDSTDRLMGYIRGAGERMSAAERRALYARTLGAPGSAVDGEANREFDALWLRFVASVSQFLRQLRPDALPPTTPPQEDVRTHAKALALNLSAHGAGLSLFARALTSDASQMLDMLRLRDFQEAFGVRDIWRLVERVASQELGAAPRVAQRRTMAEQGMRIFAWLATRPRGLWTSGGDALDVAVLTSQQHSADPTATPTDVDLVDACEQWLAVIDIGDADQERPLPDTTGHVPEALRLLLSRGGAFAQLPPAAQTTVVEDGARLVDYLSVMDTPSRLRDFMDAVDFPNFVRELIAGVFDAIVDATARQMAAYADLLAAVSTAIDDFRSPDRSDREVLTRLCEAYPPLCERTSVITAATSSPAGAPYPFETPDLPPPLDLVGGAAWRRLASSRQQLLATMVIMGIDRIARR